MEGKKTYEVTYGEVRVPCVPEPTWGPAWLAESAAVPETAAVDSDNAQPCDEMLPEAAEPPATDNLHGVLLAAINAEMAADGLEPLPPDAFELLEPESDWWGSLSPEQAAELTAPLPKYTPCTFCGGRTVHNPRCYTLHAWPRLAFGRHKGKPINEVPADYLQWCVDEGAIHDAELADAIASYLETTNA